MLAPYARLETALTLTGGAALTSLVTWWAGWWGLVPAILALALLAFYRDPPRRIPSDPRLILAPADGKLVGLTRDTDGSARLRLTIFLSVLDVHVNRSPCAARVAEVRYVPGEFLNALNHDADTRNESNTLVLEPAAPLPGPIYVRQIAGVLARRIVCVAGVGHHLRAGQRYGMIKLGSRTEVSLPDAESWQVLVGVGDRLRGGETVLARWREPDPLLARTAAAADLPAAVAAGAS